MTFLTTPDGVRLRLCVRGTGSRPILLVHGWKMSHRVFDHAILRLAARHRVVAFDLRGMGESDKPDGRYDFDELAADLGHVVAELGIEDATLVGWSMGCTVALKYLENGGGGIGRLALVNGPIRLVRSTDHSFPWTMSEETLERYFSEIEHEWPTRERAFTIDSLLAYPAKFGLVYRVPQEQQAIYRRPPQQPPVPIVDGRGKHTNQDLIGSG